MYRTNRRNTTPEPNPVLFIFECVMAVFYLAIAYILLFTKYLQEIVVDNVRIPLGILLGAYGLFRVYRGIRKYLDSRNTEDEE